MTDTSALSKVIEFVPDRPLSSLYDIAMLYAGCDLYSKFSFVEADISGVALQAMTPQAKQGLYGDPHSLISVMVDLSGETPALGDPPVMFETYEKEDRYKVAYMSRAKKGGAHSTDYGITNHANGYPPERLVFDNNEKFLSGRLTRWPNHEEAQEYIEEGNDTRHIIQGLQELGENKRALATVQRYMMENVPFEGEKEALVTVQVKLEPGGGYCYPGEIEELNDVGVERRYSHLREGIGSQIDDSNGEGVGYVTGEEGTVLGGGPGIRAQFGKKTQERFPNLDPNQSWRARPLTERTTLGISDFNTISDDFHQLIRGIRCYYLPYPTGIISEDVFQRFYENIYTELSEAPEDEFISEVRSVLFKSSDSTSHRQDEQSDGPNYSALDDDDWLSTYMLFHNAGSDPSRTLIDEPEPDLSATVGLSNTYTSLESHWLSSPVFGDCVEDNPFLPANPISDVLSGSLFLRLTSSVRNPDADPSEVYGQMNDPFLTTTGEFLSGSQVSYQTLIESYVNKLILEGEKGSQGSRIQEYLVFAQLLQLQALDERELLQTGRLMTCKDSIFGRMDTQDFEDPDKALGAFLDSHEALSSPAARTAFLSGCFIARLSAWQYREDISHRLVDDFPVSAISSRNIREVVSTAIEKNEMYQSAADGAGPSNERYSKRLPSEMLETEPEDWDMRRTEFRWFYALGLAYGKSEDTSRSEDAETAEGDS